MARGKEDLDVNIPTGHMLRGALLQQMAQAEGQNLQARLARLKAIPAEDEVFSQRQLYRYANHLVTHGAGLEAGDVLVLDVKTQEAPLAIAMAEEAYRMGASSVRIFTDPEHIKAVAQKLKQAGSEATIHDGQDESQWDSALASNAAFMMVNNGSARLAHERAGFNQAIADNTHRWNFTWYPTQKLAEGAYGDDPKAIEKFAQDLLSFSRCDDKDPIDAAVKHQARLNYRAQVINRLQLDEIIIQNPDNDTQIKFGLLDKSHFRPCAWETENGNYFACNLPSEEIFCTPDPAQTEGTFEIIRPLNIGGAPITRLRGAFKNGELQREGLYVESPELDDLTPEEAADMVYGYFKQNPGMLSVGELALVGRDSRIGSSERIYGINNIDENSGVHFALGDSYLAGLSDMQDDPRRNRAANGMHRDLTISHGQTNVWGVRKDGKNVQLMRNGNWMIPDPIEG